MSLYCMKCGVETETTLACALCNKEIKHGDYWYQKIMRAWHRFIIEQFSNCCADCGHSAPTESGELCGDHVVSQGADKRLRFDVTNGICRCLPCHNKRHTGELSPTPTSMKSKQEPKKKTSSKNYCKHPHCNLMPLSGAPWKDGLCCLHQPSLARHAVHSLNADAE